MAKPYKVGKFVISTQQDIAQLEVFLNSVDIVKFITATDGSVIVIYQEK